MHSELVNASQLLSSFLESENEKISQNICGADFAGELKKLIRQPSSGAGELSKKTVVKSENSKTSDSGSQASSTATTATSAANGTKTSGLSTNREQKGATDSKAKINGVKSKTKAAESVCVSNTAATNTILADLQYPAETRRACKDLQSNEGTISVKNLKNLLDAQSPVGSASPAKVTAEHANEFVNSIIAKGGGTNQQRSTSGESLQADLQLKTEGSYSHKEFLGLLEKILQHAQSTQQQSTDSESSSGSTQTAKTSGALKASQTRSLTASAIPSFISGDAGKSLDKNVLASEVKNPALEVKNENVSGTRGDSIEALSDKLQSGSTLSGDKTATAGYDRGGTALGEAGKEGGGARSAQDSGTVLSSVRQKTSDMSAASLDSMLKNFDARIVSTDSQQGEAKAVDAQASNGSVEGSVAQTQNLASQVKGAEKEADRSLGASSSSRLSQDSGEHSEAGEIKTVPAEYPSSEWSSDSGSKGSTDSAQENGAQAPAAKFDPKETSDKAEVIKNADSETVAAKPDTVSGKAVRTEAVSGQSGDSVSGLTAKTGSEEIAAESGEVATNNTGKAASALASETPAETGVKTAVHAESASETLRAGCPVEDSQTKSDGSVYGSGSNSGLSTSDGISAKTDANTINTAQSHAAFLGEAAAALAKASDKQLENSDLVADGAVFQNSASSFQGSEINVSRMENSAQNGSSYDSYRMVQLVQNMQEQSVGVSGQQLVLEMEPTDLGKISLKVEAKRDEISVVALTDNESARQTLMKNSSGLRQDLQDQGLVLDKFMVDVNSSKSGGGNNSQDETQKQKSLPVSKTTKVGGIQTSAGPAYSRKTDGQSQINIFA